MKDIRLIDAGALREKAHKEFRYLEITLKDIDKLINAAPTIEPPRGEWLCRDNRSTITAIGYIMEWYECSLCGATHATYDGKYKHCPHCGAKMKGGE
jgi:rubrerythrin